MTEPVEIIRSEHEMSMLALGVGDDPPFMVQAQCSRGWNGDETPERADAEAEGREHQRGRRLFEWALTILNYQDGDELADIFPGTGCLADVISAHRQRAFEIQEAA